MDHMYVLDYLINRQLYKKERKLVALFVDLKAAFDSVDRGVLVRIIRGRVITDMITERVVELLRETRSRVMVKREIRGTFWMAREVKQMPVEFHAI